MAVDGNAYACYLRGLRAEREARKARQKRASSGRRSLSATERKTVLAKTAGRCHICGGEINGAWQADHVLAYSGGGAHHADNYLPAHPVCNNYRWDYTSEEFQAILKLGVWARTQVERETTVGREIASGFCASEAARERRRLNHQHG